MSASSAVDPVRVTLLAILEQLDQAESDLRARAPPSALGLAEIESRLSGFEPVQCGAVQVALALGLLVRQGLVQARGGGGGSWQRQRSYHQLYQITPEGRKFLFDSLRTAGRNS